MNIIYIHGINSNQNARKAKLLADYCAEYHPNIQVHCPDLNDSPTKVMALLREMLIKYEKSAIVGSSLGGFFATQLVHEFGCPTILINPSLNPHLTLQRYLERAFSDYQEDEILYITKGGWQLSLADFAWFEQHRIEHLKHVSRILLLLKQGDATLDYRVAESYFTKQNVPVQQRIIETGGDHIMSDFAEKIPQVIEFIQQQWTYE